MKRKAILELNISHSHINKAIKEMPSGSIKMKDLAWELRLMATRISDIRLSLEHS